MIIRRWSVFFFFSLRCQYTTAEDEHSIAGSALSSLIWRMCLFHVLMIGYHTILFGVEGGSCRNIKAAYSF